MQDDIVKRPIPAPGRDSAHSQPVASAREDSAVASQQQTAPEQPVSPSETSTEDPEMAAAQQSPEEQQVESTQTKTTQDNKKPKKKSGHFGVITFAIIVFVALTGVAVYAEIQGSDTTSTNENTVRNAVNLDSQLEN